MLELSKTDIVILAGGLGKRLASVTGGGQKILAEIDGKPFISILIDYIASQGGRRFILCTGHGAKSVEDTLRGAHPQLEIIFSVEQEPLGTGGAIKQGASYVKTDRFIAMNGDCFCVIDYNALITHHRAKGAQATLAVTKVDDAREYGTIELDQDNNIAAFKEKQPWVNSALINTGTYCLTKDVFSLVNTSQKFSIEYDFFPFLVGHGFCAFEVANQFIDIGTPDRYQWAQEHLKYLSGKMKRFDID